MGYAHYTLPDGRAAGYGVEDVCNRDDCNVKIDRGMAYLCGDAPDGHRAEDQPGCGRYFCDPHLADHDCPNPECGTYNEDESKICLLAQHPAGEPHDFTEL